MLDFLRILVQSPRIYDLVQGLAGDRRLQERLAVHLQRLPTGALVVDIGGGTGLSAGLGIQYICLDIDAIKLSRFRVKHVRRLAVAADAVACPFPDAAIDAALCLKVTHHLADHHLRQALMEARRVLRPGGVLILADAIRSERVVSRLLWRFDRGSYPRTPDAISRAFPPGLTLADMECFRLGWLHDFVMYIAQRQ